MLKPKSQNDQVFSPSRKKWRYYVEKIFSFPVLEFWKKGAFYSFLRLFHDFVRYFPNFVGRFQNFKGRNQKNVRQNYTNNTSLFLNDTSFLQKQAPVSKKMTHNPVKTSENRDFQTLWESHISQQLFLSSKSRVKWKGVKRKLLLKINWFSLLSVSPIGH